MSLFQNVLSFPEKAKQTVKSKVKPSKTPINKGFYLLGFIAFSKTIIFYQVFKKKKLHEIHCSLKSINQDQLALTVTVSAQKVEVGIDKVENPYKGTLENPYKQRVKTLYFQTGSVKPKSYLRKQTLENPYKQRVL